MTRPGCVDRARPDQADDSAVPETPACRGFC